jgi:5-methylcytosine-specific restriction endonuclease McrA
MIYRIGKIYGLLKVIALDTTRKKRSYLCHCACGNVVSVRSSDFQRTTSCGCLIRELRLKQKEKNKSNSFGSAKDRLFYYKATRELFAEIRQRDNNHCVFCSAESNLHVHHILRKSIYPQYRLCPENLVTLCEKCHIFEAHSGNTSTSNLVASDELLKIVFENTKKYTVNPAIIKSTKDAFKDIL